MTEKLQPIEQQVKKALLEALLSFRKERNLQAKKLCVALSGGIDSIVLLTIVHRLVQERELSEIELEAFHVDHGISLLSGVWREFCQNACEQKNIPFFSTELKLKKQKQRSLEADARDARYQALCEHAEKDSLVLLGQHQSDQTETFLLQVKRGSGLAGLACMPLFMLKQNVAFARPLLNVAKQHIVEFANSNGLKWCEDHSNNDDSFDRNFLRNNIIPELQNRWPHIHNTVSRVADNCALALKVNDEYMALLSSSLRRDNTIDLERFSRHSKETKLAFLQYTSSSFIGEALSKKQLYSLLSLCESTDNNTAFLLFGCMLVERFQKKLVISILNKEELEAVKISSIYRHNSVNTVKVNLSNQSQIIIDSHTEMMLIPENERLELESLAINNQIEGEPSHYVINQKWCEQHNIVILPGKQFELHVGASHLKFKYQSNRPTKTLKSWYQEWSVSPIQRRLTSVITSNNIVYAVLTSPLKVTYTVVAEPSQLILARVNRS